MKNRRNEINQRSVQSEHTTMIIPKINNNKRYEMSKHFKYTVHGFQQKKLIESGLTADDALVASVILDMYSSEAMTKAEINGDRYIWVSQRSLHKYIPIIGSESKIRRTLNKLVSKGFIVKEIAHDKDGGKGCFTFIKPTIEMSYLTEYSNEDVENSITRDDQWALVKLTSGALVKMSSARYSKRLNKDTPTTDSPNIYSKHYGISDAEVTEIIEIWNSIIGVPNIRSLNKTSARFKALNARFKEHKFEGLLEMLTKVRASNFLTGKNKEGWAPNFDWVLNPTNFVKIIEDSYINKELTNETNFNNNHKPGSFKYEATKLSRTVDENRHILDEIPDDHRF